MASFVGQPQELRHNVWMKLEAIDSLPNIGPTIARYLQHIGIRTRSDLYQAGAVAAYLHLQASFPDKRFPVCYYLYSLQGALDNCHWNDVPKPVKEQLVAEVKRRGLGA